MKFEDVENARKAYLDKKARVQKKAILIAAGIEVVLILIVVLVNVGSFRRVFAAFHDFTPILIMPLLIAILFLALIPVIVIAIITSVSTNDELVHYKKAYKGYFVERELAKKFLSIKYSHSAGLDKSILESTGMINTGDRYSSNDLTMGKYKNVNFAQADVHIEEEYEDNDGDTHYRTIFRGRFMIFEFPKKFNSKMMLSHHNEPISAMNRIETESTEFNKAFLVYAEDGMEAFYILTPDFMERVQELGRSHNDQVSIYFAENKMVVGINDGDDIFEPPNPKIPLDEKAETAKITNELNLVTNIVDNLKLSRKI